ncbi:hypothetical protein JQ824_06040 [Brachyspira hyodysenteriae]|uniref:Nuclease n=2 Tax=Brachyspira hyodysenteriae TaxID=159 RepID=A0A3B6VR51_BRAHO|nr:hypothetical protein [Brachyspira hyodysenteriae]ACN84472.1 hypothetical membrane-spanning protein [Brachyspira hyodysenteriae WA1]ANN63445.1 hypothetical protein BHYOB78_06075 [Brachyspira hyodysenteriae ATCC 27164]AUJ50205.1 hypothetical protein BH718_01770 [Brachyspira hyodysenteriae]KLI13933.1 nuclease [Brachyspira hyodysenteriae]KLI16529.1 nuclease [Brachyspira hyodysenteriae]
MKKVITFIIILMISANLIAQNVVYITKTGKKYHLQNCRTIRGEAYKISLSEAKQKGYTACKVCKPY